MPAVSGGGRFPLVRAGEPLKASVARSTGFPGVGSLCPFVGPTHTLTCMTGFLLTGGDVARGRPPDVASLSWRCGIVDPSTGAVCTMRPHGEDLEHQGFEAVQGGGRDRRAVAWRGGEERAM